MKRLLFGLAILTIALGIGTSGYYAGHYVADNTYRPIPYRGQISIGHSGISWIQPVDSLFWESERDGFEFDNEFARELLRISDSMIQAMTGMTSSEYMKQESDALGSSI